MQTKSKQKSNLNKDSILNKLSQLSDQTDDSKADQYVQCGAICGDGTYTPINGRGAGSRHQGVKYKLYVKRSDFQAYNQNPISKFSFSQALCNIQASKFQKSSLKQSYQCLATTCSSQKPRKKISLKQNIKTRAKRVSLFENVHTIFENVYKDDLQIVQEQIQDQIWLLFASISSLHQQLTEANNLLKTLQDKNQLKFYDNNFKLTGQSQDSLKSDLEVLRKQNVSMKKQIQKLLKQNSMIQENLAIYKLKERNFKKMLKIIERQDPKTLCNALYESKIKLSDLKSLKKQQNKVITRSTVKKSTKKQKKVESLFSSDEQSEFFDEDQTIRSIIKSLK